jgi:hypothetical protein
MRSALFILLQVFLLAGCASPGSRSERTAETPSATATPTSVTPLPHSSGRVVAVNPDLRFVVVDFFPSPLPAPEQRMSIYRDGQKVGEIRISGPARESAIAADIMEGEAAVGDEALAER